MPPSSAGVKIDGDELRRLRSLQGDDLKPFAAKADISFQYVSQLELGVRDSVSPSVFGRICQALGLETGEERERLVAKQPAA